MDVNTIVFALIVSGLYLGVISPSRRRARHLAEIKENLQPGVEVMTTAGMFGRVDHVDEENMFLEVAPGVVMRFTRAAVGKIIVPKEEKGPTPPDGPQDEGPPAPKTL